MGGLVLDAPTAPEILRAQGFVAPSEDVRIQPLSGGVSATVLRAEAGPRRFVLKQPHTRFRVQREWIVDDRRAFVEHAFVRAVGPQLPGEPLPRVRSFLPESRILIFDAAPPSFAAWKARLLEGTVDPRLAAAAGRLLAAIHDAGESTILRGRFDHADLFQQQRLDPYFGECARQMPDLAPLLEGLVRGFGQRADLVHGDFSPKNLLTDGARLLLVDHEVAARGDAAFDLSFFLTHLVLKALHRHADAARFLAAADRFVEAYEEARPGAAAIADRAAAYLGGLLVARVRGKSPAEYLDEAEASRALRVGSLLLRERPASWARARPYLGMAE